MSKKSEAQARFKEMIAKKKGKKGGKKKGLIDCKCEKGDDDCKCKKGGGKCKCYDEDDD